MRVLHHLLIVLVAFLFAPVAAVAAPDLTGKELQIDLLDDQGRTNSTLDIVVQGGEAGAAQFTAQFRNPPDSALRSCGPNPGFVGTYSTSGALNIRYLPNQDARINGCHGYAAELTLQVNGDGSSSGKGINGPIGTVFEKAVGKCVNCDPGSTNWLPWMVTALIAFLGLYASTLKSRNAQNQSAPSTRRDPKPPNKDDKPSFRGLNKSGSNTNRQP